MPGDAIASSLPTRGIVHLGSGVDIRSSQNTISNISQGRVTSSSAAICATEVGILRTLGGEESAPKQPAPSSSPRTHMHYSVMSLHKKAYTHPLPRDAVIGCVVKTGAEYYDVDIRATTVALLPVLGFDNATKRNRPMLKVGDVVYGTLTEVSGVAGGGYAAERIMMDCCNNVDGDGFGPLYVSPVSSSSRGVTRWTGNAHGIGMIFKVTPSYARYLLSNGQRPESILAVLGSRIPFDIVIGVNGLFWISSLSSSSNAHLETCILGTVIQCMERESDVSPQHVLFVLERHMKSGK